MKKKKIAVIIIGILLFFALFTPFERYSYIADGLLAGYHSLMMDVCFFGRTTINETTYEGVSIYVLGHEVFNNYDSDER